MEQKKVSWDVLAATRFALAAIVMVAHLGVPLFSNRLVTAVVNLGAFTAVLGFLVLSGFSIAHSYSQNKEGYFRRRMLRIYPLYALAIAYTVICNWTLAPQSGNSLLKAAFGNLAFLDTYSVSPIPNNPVVWTLAIEATFYLLTPLLARLSTGSLFVWTGVSLLAFCAYPHFALDYFAWLHFGLSTLFIGWAWLAGFLYHRCQNHPASGTVLIASLIAACNINVVWNGRYSQLTLIVVGLLLLHGNVLRPGIWLKKTFIFLGNLSYPLYLFHYPTFFVCRSYLHHHVLPMQILFSVVVSLIVLGIDHVLKAPLNTAWLWTETRASALITSIELTGSRLAEQALGGGQMLARVFAPKLSGTTLEQVR